MRALRQGGRGINEYIADFQRLLAQLPSMAEEDALFAFEAGVSREIAVELRKQRTQTVADAISLAAHVGSVSVAAPAQGRLSAANQMDVDDGDAAGMEDRIARSVLNALQGQSSGFQGLGAKTQTQRGYASERDGGRGGAARGGRGGRFGGGQRPLPVVPGVPSDVVRQRLDAQQCVRCGADGHRSPACPNAISALGN